MTEQGIVVGVDGSADSAAALRWAADEAVRRGVRLTLVSAAQPPLPPIAVPYGSLPWGSGADPERQARAALDAVLADTELPDGLDVRTEATVGNAAHRLIQASAEADLLVVGSRGHGGFVGLLLGSTSQQVVQHASCPVVVVRAPRTGGAEPRRSESVRPITTPGRPAPVVVGVDGSPDARNAAQYAVDLAGAWGTDLVVAHAFSLGGEVVSSGGGFVPDLRADGEGLLADVLARLRVPSAVRVTTYLELATPAELLGRLSAEAAAVVVGQHPVGWLERLVTGNMTAAIAKHVSCPTVVVPGDWRYTDAVAGDVVVALDGQNAAAEALEMAASEAARHGSRLVALHAVPAGAPASAGSADRRALAEVLAGVRQDYPDVGVETRLVPGDPEDVVAEVTERARLVVIGKPRSRRPGAWSRSVAHHVVTRSACPLLIVPQASGEPGRLAPPEGAER